MNIMLNSKHKNAVKCAGRCAAVCRRVRLNKKGEEIVEAAIVLPLIILVILSMILLLIFFYSCLQSQIDVHHELLKRQETFSGLYRISTRSECTEKQMQGLSQMVMRKEFRGQMYLMQPADLILAGKEAEIYFKK